jgi:predicted site-specific integrase-resolvase
VLCGIWALLLLGVFAQINASIDALAQGALTGFRTIRRWAERGLLQAVRLPSGVRRFRPEDVEAMRAQMFSGFAPLREGDDVVTVERVRSIE